MAAKERVYNGKWCETPAGENLHQTTSVIPKIFRIPESESGLIFFPPKQVRLFIHEINVSLR